MKKHLFLSALTLFLSLGLFSSCGEDVSSSSDAKGRISPLVEVESGLVEMEIVSRSLSTPNIKASDLYMRLTSADGSFSREWASVKDFNAEEKFPVGDYTVEVGYADPKAEGLKCTPAYHASQDIKIFENQTTPVALTATRTHAYVSVTFSDAVKGYFRRVAVDVKSASGKTTTFVYSPSYTETASACIIPGNAVIMVDLEKKNGIKGDNIKIADFEAIARGHYHINLDVNEGEIGSPTLSVSFDETTEQRHVEVDLSDEMLTTPAPELSLEGVEDGATLEFVEGCYDGDPVKVNIIARGDIASVILDSHSTYLYDVCSWPLSVDLATVTDEDRDHLLEVGLQCKGIWNTSGREPSRMGYVDFTEVLNNINYIDDDPTHGNECSFELTATDGNGKTTETPVSFYAKINKLQFGLSNPSEIKFFDTTLAVDLGFNGGDPTGRVEFSVMKDDLGTGAYYEAVTIAKIEAAGENNYRVSLSDLPTYGSVVTLRAQYKEHVADITVERVSPAFNLTTAAGDIDVYATKAYVSVESSEVDPAMLAAMTSIWSGNNKLTVQQVANTAMLFVSGLEPGKANVITASLTDNPENVCDPITLNTETADDSLDSGFDDWIGSNTGKGTYQYLWSVNPSDKWATLNELTTSQSGTSSIANYAYKATSGTIPANGRSTESSTSDGFFGTDRHADGHTAGNKALHSDKANKGSANAALIRTVGWGSGNAANAGTSSNQGFSTCQHTTPGELYVGKYENGDTIQSIEFSSRPAGVEFYYCYQTVESGNGDYGTVEVAVYGDDPKTPLAYNKEKLTGLSISGSAVSYERFYLPLDYKPGSSKATKIKVVFRSSEYEDALQHNLTFWTTPGGSNRSGGEYVGSELYIDDVKLIY